LKSLSDAPTALPKLEGPRIVGIGASAGGLEALEKFFTHLPMDTDMAYVVVQHTSAEHKTLLGILLQRLTALPVHEAHNGLVVAANSIYVMPTSGELTVVRGCLHFTPTTKMASAPLAIDAFLTSLAHDQADLAVGVVLSGMGHDGVQGLQAIHQAKGLCLAQQPETAAYPSMPQSAIDAGCVDVVAAPQDMPRQIVERSLAGGTPHANGALSGASDAFSEQPSAADPLKSIVELLHQHVHHDFSLYKPSTLLRRIERRMHVHELPSMAAYLQHLHNNPSELDLLFSEMLIGVTAFFRDSQVWLDLSAHVLPTLIASDDHTAIRAWVLGCSTGEEAYSLAMLLREAQDRSGQPSRSVQIYATDLNATAIAVARKGWYSPQTVSGISPDRLDRFFTPCQGGYLVRPDLRAMVMFARHDVIADLPFTQLDLLLCRNLLIYFNASLQRRLIPLFHFCLRAGGTLVLGSAETAGRSQNLFTALRPQSRIYARSEQRSVPGSVAFPIHRRSVAPLSSKELSVSSLPPASNDNLQSLADQVLLQSFSPAAVLVNSAGDILYISGRTGHYLEPAAGKANWNIHVMAKPGLRAQMATALRQAMQEGHQVVLHGLPLEGHRHRQLQITVHPLQEPKSLAGSAMVIFNEQEVMAATGSQPAPSASAVNAELRNAQEALQALRQEMHASRDQLSEINESLKLTNEELQSANEELTTSKEEAQSMNEELQTINSELQTRLDDLALAQSDMQNLLNSTDIATLFLDNDLNVRRFTEKAVGIFHLRETDVGRPLSDLANTMAYPLLQDDVKETLRTLTPCTKSVAATDGRWFSVRIMPYRTLANTVNGAVLTFVDISTAKALEFRLRETNAPPQTPETS
jgi:two-component system CheB/CheR fusion protein